MAKKAKSPACDPTSLGSLLLNSGLVSSKQLDEALHFQQDNADLLLGEALVRMGVLSREMLEAALMQQELARKGATKQTSSQVRRVLKMATQQTIATAGAGVGLVQTFQSLADKMGSK